MTKQVLQQALEALTAMTDMMECGDEHGVSGAWYRQAKAAIEDLREALAQQPALSTASKSEQLLASHDHALRAEFQRMKAELAQQGEQQYDKTEMNAFVQNLYDQKMQEGKHGHYETMFNVVHAAIRKAHGIGAAPAAQPDTWTDDGGWTFPIEKPTKE